MFYGLTFFSPWPCKHTEIHRKEPTKAVFHVDWPLNSYRLQTITTTTTIIAMSTRMNIHNGGQFVVVNLEAIIVQFIC